MNTWQMGLMTCAGQKCLASWTSLEAEPACCLAPGRREGRSAFCYPGRWCLRRLGISDSDLQALSPPKQGTSPLRLGRGLLWRLLPRKVQTRGSSFEKQSAVPTTRGSPANPPHLAAPLSRPCTRTHTLADSTQIQSRNQKILCFLPVPHRHTKEEEAGEK